MMAKKRSSKRFLTKESLSAGRESIDFGMKDLNNLRDMPNVRNKPWTEDWATSRVGGSKVIFLELNVLYNLVNCKNPEERVAYRKLDQVLKRGVEKRQIVCVSSMAQLLEVFKHGSLEKRVAVSATCDLLTKRVGVFSPDAQAYAELVNAAATFFSGNSIKPRFINPFRSWIECLVPFHEIKYPQKSVFDDHRARARLEEMLSDFNFHELVPHLEISQLLGPFPTTDSIGKRFSGLGKSEIENELVANFIHNKKWLVVLAMSDAVQMITKANIKMIAPEGAWLFNLITSSAFVNYYITLTAKLLSEKKNTEWSHSLFDNTNAANVLNYVDFALLDAETVDLIKQTHIVPKAIVFSTRAAGISSFISAIEQLIGSTHLESFK